MSPATQAKNATEPTAHVRFDMPKQGTFEAIYAALDAYTGSQLGPSGACLLVIPLHDDSGMVQGGLWGHTAFGWFYIQMLYVPDSWRGRGIGTRIMVSAEAEAIRRRCRGAHLTTYAIQALGFYQRLGFVQFGKIEECPRGHDLVMLKKSFLSI